MRQLRYTAALAVQAGGRLLFGGHILEPGQRVAFTAISIFLVMFAGMMSGLTLGLCSMDLVELEVLKRSGTAKEQLYAAAIMPILSNQHFLLVTLLLCNACAMEALPLFLDRLADPVTAIVISVTAVLVFGEILPQAVCTRYGLAIGYYCAWFVRGLMAVTSPISWPIGKLLDFVLGSEHRALFRRGQLKALVDIHGADEGLGGNLSEDEIKVICGALDLTNKTARKSMTALNKVFMLPADARLNMSTMRAILASGHSRIPVYTSGDRSSIIGLILVKELLQYKTHQEVPVSEVRMRSLPRLPADTPMYDMLKLFQTGRSHMVVLTDTPATARAAAEAEAAAARAAAEAAAAEAGADSDSSSGSSPSRLRSMLSGRKSRKQRQQFQSALLQPPEEQQQQQEADASSTGAQAGSAGGAWIAALAEEAPNTNGNGNVSLYPEQDMLGFGFEVQPPQFLSPHLQDDLSSSVLGHSLHVHTQPQSAVVREQEMVPSSPSAGGSGRPSQLPGIISSSSSSKRVPGAAGEAAGGRSVQFSSDHTVLGPSEGANLQQQTQTQAAGDDTQGKHRRRESNGSGTGSDSGNDEQRLRRSHSRIPHARSKSGPLPNVFKTPSLLSLGLEGAPEGVAVPIGIITIEDVIEELMQAEIVDETDLYLDNERTIAVNAAQLAQSLPAQLRKALGPALSRNPSQPGSARVTVRKLIKQRSSSSLGFTSATSAGTGSGSGTQLLNRPMAQSDGGIPSTGAASTGGISAAVTAGLAAAAAAVKGGDGRSIRSAEQQPLLNSADRSAPV